MSLILGYLGGIEKDFPEATIIIYQIERREVIELVTRRNKI